MIHLFLLAIVYLRKINGIDRLIGNNHWDIMKHHRTHFFIVRSSIWTIQHSPKWDSYFLLPAHIWRSVSLCWYGLWRILYINICIIPMRLDIHTMFYSHTWHAQLARYTAPTKMVVQYYIERPDSRTLDSILKLWFRVWRLINKTFWNSSYVGMVANGNQQPSPRHWILSI